MAYILRFVQCYHPEQRQRFMELEAAFAELEKRRPDLPRGRRRQPFAGREASNTLIWECEFATLQGAQEALAKLVADPEHETLYRQQVPCFAEAYTEIDEVLDF